MNVVPLRGLPRLQPAGPRPCPVWCEEDHDEDPVDPVIETRMHSLTVGRVRIPADYALEHERHARVTVEQCESLVDGARHAARVFVDQAEGLDPAAARALAAGLLRAARLIEDWGAR